jgi:hypothetical protein
LWTKTLIQSYEDDLSYETVVLTTGGLLLLVQDGEDGEGGEGEEGGED